MRDGATVWHVTANDRRAAASRPLDTRQDTPPDVLACDHD
ncbi:hypothetical protein OPKNFCMD_2916 [Methylobacterium crusticola]|uniref:Uncharacterized protein n=1 Tax=Methylobacterium crusticola TaxID=1697972 RepID=A0ABQ4QZT7_9HYPH|nr:hypothetical protein OPKNFCMD_2916 [Methylobacterium crusticola]